MNDQAAAQLGFKPGGFGGMMLPVSAIRISWSILTGNMANATANSLKMRGTINLNAHNNDV
jgi:hypothetical protein